METNHKPKTSAKDFIVNLGAIIALGMTSYNLVSLLFTIIDKAYPPISSYNYYSTYSIAWPVSILIIFYPIYILLMWLLEKDYKKDPERRNVGVRKWLTYITLFLAGIAIAGDLVAVLYSFINGENFTTSFVLKVISILVVAVAIFFYYISDVMGKINSTSRKVWAGVSLVIILGVIIWGFSVIGSPRTQALYRYDEQKVSDLQIINSEISGSQTLPAALSDLNDYNYTLIDQQTGAPYEYNKTGAKTYELCAVFNKASVDDDMNQPRAYGASSWSHPAGHYCFSETITK